MNFRTCDMGMEKKLGREAVNGAQLVSRSSATSLRGLSPPKNHWLNCERCRIMIGYLSNSSWTAPAVTEGEKSAATSAIVIICSPKSEAQRGHRFDNELRQKGPDAVRVKQEGVAE